MRWQQETKSTCPPPKDHFHKTLRVAGERARHPPRIGCHSGIHVWTSLVYGSDNELVKFRYYWNGGFVWKSPFGTPSDDALAMGLLTHITYLHFAPQKPTQVGIVGIAAETRGILRGAARPCPPYR